MVAQALPTGPAAIIAHVLAALIRANVEQWYQRSSAGYSQFECGKWSHI